MKTERFFNCWMAVFRKEYIFASACHDDKTPRLDNGGKGTWLVSRYLATYEPDREPGAKPSWKFANVTRCLVFDRTKNSAIRDAKLGFQGRHELLFHGTISPWPDMPLAVQFALFHRSMLRTLDSPLADLEYHEHASAIYLMLGAARNWSDIYTVYKMADHLCFSSLRDQIRKALVTKDPADLEYFRGYGGGMSFFANKYDLVPRPAQLYVSSVA